MFLIHCYTSSQITNGVSGFTAQGECEWRNQRFNWSDLQTYLGHVHALNASHLVRPDGLHLLFSKAGFDERVQAWAASTRARLVSPADLLAPL
jgi:hypothetical protein